MDELAEWLPTQAELPTNELRADFRTPAVIDFGSSVTRVGVASASSPSHEFLTRAARYRDRKTGQQRTVVGNDLLLDVSARNATRSPFDGPLLTNWDPTEMVLDYSLNLLGFSVERPSPIAISEPVLLPHLSHRTLQELLFEGYAAPKVAFAADALAAAHHALSTAHHALSTAETTQPIKTTENSERLVKTPAETNALHVFLGAESTHVVPILRGRPQLSDARRINFSGTAAAGYLHSLLVLKYPTFPVPVSRNEVSQMLRKHCLVAEDYDAMVRRMMDLDFLAEFAVQIQAPYPAEPPKDAEQEQRQAERRKESGRRLQEQAALARIERQQQQQEQIDELRAWDHRLRAENSVEDAEAQAQQYGFQNLNDLRRTIKQLENNLRRARGEAIEDPEPATPLLNVPDDALSVEEIKEKRRQKLLRASYDARQRAKAAKEAKKRAEAAREAKEAEWRQRDLRGWAFAKREKLAELLTVIREQEKIRNDPKLRFRNSLMDDAPPTKRTKSVKRAVRAAAPKPEPKNEDLTDLAAVEELSAEVLSDDEDLGDEAEGEPDYSAEANALKALLLEHDPSFSLEEVEPQRNWRNSTVHKFLWGARPYDLDDVAQNYQLNLNIERIRAVEPLFQPAMVGLDQAGLSEVCAELLRKHPQLVSNVQLSGGFASISGLKQRLMADLRRELPVDVAVHVRVAEEPQLDAWRGLAELSLDESIYITRQQYDEQGPDYERRHVWI